jgi:DNA-binding NarL/FixJ family response regulator
MTKTVNNVLIVEDHTGAAQILSEVAALIFDNPKVSLSSTVAGGMELLNNNHFDIALLDLGLPDGNGVELVQQLSVNAPDTISVVTTIFDDESHLFDALQAGASGYLLKGHSVDELATYLKNALEGRPALSPSIAQSILGYFRQENSFQTALPTKETLTIREIEILRLIAKGHEVKNVSEALNISKHTVSVHIKNIYRKLGVHNRAEATAAALELNIYK